MQKNDGDHRDNRMYGQFARYPDILFAEDLVAEGLSAEHVHAKLRCANRDVILLAPP